MSGSCISSGISSKINSIREIGLVFQLMIHPKILSPTLSHIAIQLNMENDKDIIIMEYGQYLTENSEKMESSIFSSCDNYSNSYKRVKKHEYNSGMLYLNRDGLRITIIDDKYFDKNERKSKKSYLVSQIIASNHYGIKFEKFDEINSKLHFRHLYECIDCNIGNYKILKELCDNFKGKKWEAKNYNVITHNCQHFAAEIIKLLKATRKYDNDKIRSIEKSCLPNCIISALWDNEKLSFTNTMGRIPIFGLFYDLYRLKKL